MAYERKDAFYRKAKAAGYRSRAAYKLLELDQKYRIFRRGDRVLDLGSWPGGWLQVAAEAVGPQGRVLGIDLERVAPLPNPWVRLFRADMRDENVHGEISEALAGPADVVLSDMAPKLSGIRDRDVARSMELAHLALEVAQKTLGRGGKLLVKLFDAPDVSAIVDQMRGPFSEVQTIRPAATRRGSSEIYALTSGFVGKGAPLPPAR